MPLVSAVIPTRNRPTLVTRAVRSALAQSFRDIEVVVVIDGPDSVTESVLLELADDRVRVITLNPPVGACEARNCGVRAATGHWIAYLDDDDEWMPEKIERQLKRASTSVHKYPVISCKIIARTPKADFIWPRHEPWLPISDYLMSRREWFKGEANLQTSTLMIPRELLLLCPFTKGLKKHQEWDWLVHAMEVPGAGVELVQDILSIWYIDEARPTISSTEDWRNSLEWANSIRPLLTGKAYSSFLLTLLSASAAKQGDKSAMYELLRSAFKCGNPTIFHLVFFCAIWMTPQSLRRSLSRLRYGKHRSLDRL